MPRWRRLLAWAAGLVFLASLLTGVTEIRPGERAVVRRFGRVLDVQPRAGLWIGLPWGIDRVDRVSVEQVRRVVVGYRPEDDAGGEEAPRGQLLTGDHNLVNVQLVLSYTVDPEAVLDYVEQADRAEGLLARLAEAILAEWVGGQPVDLVLQRGPGLLPEVLKTRLTQRLVPYRLGIVVTGVDVAPPEPPAQVKPDFDAVARARAEAEAMVEKARETAQQRRSEARIQVRKDEDATRAYVTSRPARARAEAAYFEARLAAYRADPLVREAGRWNHLLTMVRRLAEAGALQPLDPAIDLKMPGPLGKEKP